MHANGQVIHPSASRTSTNSPASEEGSARWPAMTVAEGVKYRRPQQTIQFRHDDRLITRESQAMPAPTRACCQGITGWSV